jgi:hypothetical protein
MGDIAMQKPGERHTTLGTPTYLLIYLCVPALLVCMCAPDLRPEGPRAASKAPPTILRAEDSLLQNNQFFASASRDSFVGFAKIHTFHQYHAECAWPSSKPRQAHESQRLQYGVSLCLWLTSAQPCINRSLDPSSNHLVKVVLMPPNGQHPSPGDLHEKRERIADCRCLAWPWNPPSYSAGLPPLDETEIYDCCIQLSLEFWLMRNLCCLRMISRLQSLN